MFKNKRCLTMTPLLGVMVLAVMAIGCESDTRVIGGMHDDVSGYPSITLSQSDLQAAVGFMDPILSRNDLGHMSVTQPVRARSKQPLHIEYRILWYDVAGHPVKPEMNWAAKRLEPRQPDSIGATSTSIDAQTYNIQMRWGRP